MISDTDLRRLHRYCTALCGDRDAAFDLLHASLEKIVRARGVGLGDVGLAYYYTAIRSCFIDERRRVGARPELEPLLAEDEVESDGGQTLEDLTIERDLLQKLLAALTPWERELVFLHLVEERTADEIASATGRPRGTILSMMHRTRRKLQAIEQSLKEKERSG
jgi:RNA polymerase sigma-70 factor (ECF subfamily)